MSLLRNRAAFFCIASLVCLLSVGAFFREFLTSHFNLIAGNIGDNRFIIATLEHWRTVFHGGAHFNSPDFFWPEKDVLGYSDSHFLLSLPYSIARALGMDIYLAFEMTLLLFKAAGFFSMLWLLRSFVKVSRLTALVGSALFTLSNLYSTATIGHAQLMAVVFVPLIVCLGCSAWLADNNGRRNLAFAYGAASGVLLALVLFTSFYIGWFAIIAGGLVLLTTIAAAILWNQVKSIWIGVAVGKGGILAAAAIGFCIAMIPFGVTYFPVLAKTGGRSYLENLAYSAHPLDLLNIGRENWIWGRPVNSLMLWLRRQPMVLGEQQTGWPPFTLALLVGGLVWAFRSKAFKQRSLTVVLIISFFTGWILSVKVGTHSLWWLIFKFVPGGSAIRVPARFNVVLNVILVVAASIVLNHLKNRPGRVWQAVFWAASALVIAEQINLLPSHSIQRNYENALLERVGKPPVACASFFLSSPADINRPDFADQIDAMLIARLKNVPTVNGYSGWEPKDWHLNVPDQSYLQQVRRWVRLKKIESGVCGVNARDGSWSPIDFSSIPYLPSSTIDFRHGGNAYLYEGLGWGDQEAGGSWAVSERSVLTLDLPQQPATDLLLTFKAHAFLPARRPRFEELLRVNGSEVARWSIGDPQVEERARLPKTLLGSRRIHIEFLTRDLVSPADLGLSIDSRKLGLAVEQLRIVPVSPQSQYMPGWDVDFRWGGDSYLYEEQGWGAQEEGGSWTLNARSTLLLDLPSRPVTDMALSFKSHAFVSEKRPSFTESVEVNGSEVARWSVSQPQIERRVRLPRSLFGSNSVRIDFVDHDPKSPAEVSSSGDNRKLGLAIESLRLGEAVGNPKP